MMHSMGGGIGAIRIMGWPLADWATILLLLIVSIMIVAFVNALLSLLKRPPDRAIRQDHPQAKAAPDAHLSDRDPKLQIKGTQNA